MIPLATGVSYVDLKFLDTAGIIATAVIHGPGGAALVDPGPSSTLPALGAALDAAGLRWPDVRALVLTHIHLDHAGATGTLVHQHPHLRVFVHEKGAPHLVDPAKLVASATQLYGADMDRLWGDVRPVPAGAIAVLRGGERIAAGGRTFEVAYTPGHASHHVSYFNADSGVAFVGDTAGVRLQSGGYVMPPTPPPDINLELWRDSLAQLERWRADTLFITHFGPCAPPSVHLSEMTDHLEWTAARAKASLARPGDDQAREAWFTEEIRRELRTRVGERDAQAYEIAGRFDLSWRGLARYWRKREVK